MEKTAFLFPGQGAQFVGMGRGLENQALLNEASEVLGLDLVRLCFDGPEEELKKTENAQPAIFVVSYGMFLIKGETPDVVAGHSLGESTALCASKVLDFASCLRLVRIRGELMAKADRECKGVMAAVISRGKRIEVKAIKEICGEEGIDLVNFNSPEQVVISGEKERVNRAVEKIKIFEPLFKVRFLEVDGALHSRLMKEAGEEFKKRLEEFSFRKPKIPIVFNVIADFADQPETIKHLLAEQLVSPVRWEESILKIINEGIKEFIEIGPKKVLTPLVNQTLKYLRDEC